MSHLFNPFDDDEKMCATCGDPIGSILHITAKKYIGWPDVAAQRHAELTDRLGKLLDTQNEANARAAEDFQCVASNMVQQYNAIRDMLGRIEENQGKILAAVNAKNDLLAYTCKAKESQDSLLNFALGNISKNVNSLSEGITAALDLEKRTLLVKIAESSSNKPAGATFHHPKKVPVSVPALPKKGRRNR